MQCLVRLQTHTFLPHNLLDSNPHNPRHKNLSTPQMSHLRLNTNLANSLLALIIQTDISRKIRPHKHTTESIGQFSQTAQTVALEKGIDYRVVFEAGDGGG